MRRLIYAVAAFLTGCIAMALLLRGHNPTEERANRVRVCDTIRCYYPVARDSVVVRYERVRLPVAGDKSPGLEQTGTAVADSAVADSAEVVVPIAQKEYRDSSYRVWISGYMASLDSIETYTRHDYTRVTGVAGRRRWHVGVTAGCGYGRSGFGPYIGVGVSYSIFSF